jgi:hypothetical protein
MAKNSFYTIEKQKELIQTLNEKFGDQISRSDLVKYIETEKIPYPRFLFEDKYKISRGMYSLMVKKHSDNKVESQSRVDPAKEEMTVANAASVHYLQQKKLSQQITANFVPEKENSYVPFGFFKDLSSIIKSKIFYPIFITGLSGNGKTMMVEQACAKLQRECFRVNVSIETDEDDLIGSETLVDGNIVFREGPLLQAMRRGAVVVLDEIDRGSNKLICLHAILEGKPFYNKKTGEIVHPTNGFNIIATANTKGRGSDDGKFTGAQLLDEAFLERFSLTVEQEYPTDAVEKKIILNNMEIYNCMDEAFAEKLTSWASIIRKTYLEDGIDELVSTRRLVHIVKAFSIFKSKIRSIELCVNRFDEDTKKAFIDLYNKVDGEPNDSLGNENLDSVFINEDIKPV